MKSMPPYAWVVLMIGILIGMFDVYVFTMMIVGVLSK